MKLSEAMMLGSSLCKMEKSNWNTCAIGVAATAVGVPLFDDDRLGTGRISAILETWPWSTERGDIFNSIWLNFDTLVVNGLMTFEQLVDYVKSVEPSCGECNLFSCKCEKKEVEVERSTEILERAGRV